MVAEARTRSFSPCKTPGRGPCCSVSVDAGRQFKAATCYLAASGGRSFVNQMLFKVIDSQVAAEDQ